MRQKKFQHGPKLVRWFSLLKSFFHPTFIGPFTLSLSNTREFELWQRSLLISITLKSLKPFYSVNLTKFTYKLWCETPLKFSLHFCRFGQFWCHFTYSIWPIKFISQNLILSTEIIAQMCSNPSQKLQESRSRFDPGKNLFVIVIRLWRIELRQSIWIILDFSVTTNYFVWFLEWILL